MENHSQGQRARKDERFKKADRLRKRFEYLRVQREGGKVYLPSLLVLIYPQQGKRRIGITVTQKAGNAVLRNRMKRLIREAWRLQREQIPLGFDIVLILKRTSQRVTFRGLQQQIIQLGHMMSRRNILGVK